ncbi:MAG: hypothetical protein AB8B86_10455 [Pseudomonadales bacterium]
MKIASNVLSLLLLTALFAALPAMADDTEIYTDVSACATVNQEKYRFVFIVDNSGSMSSWEFAASKATIDATITEVLNSDLDDIQVAIVNYGTNHNTREHKFDVTVPFTNDIATATNWGRHYGPGSPRFWDLQDHQPASLAVMRQANIYAAGGVLDVSEATNVQFVFFTDALRDYPWGCCSSLVSTGSANHNLGNTLLGFGEYNVLKDGSILPNGLQAQFTILHVPPGGSWYAPASRAAAAIASPGGNYTGDVEWNAGDPEGPGSKPRRYVQGTFGVSDASKILELIQQVIEEVKGITYTNVAPAVSVNAFNQLQHRDELYYSIFQPKLSARWQGNIKKFRITPEGLLVDSTASPAIDGSSGSIREDAQSFWSNVVDGAEVELGGMREQLTNSRNVYTDGSALTSSSSGEVKLQTNSQVRYEALGIGTTVGSACVEGADRNGETITVTSDGVLAEDPPLGVDGGRIILSFTTTEEVFAEVRYTRTSGPDGTVCASNYVASGTAHVCEAALPGNADSITLWFDAVAIPSTVDYMIEYNLPAVPVPTACPTLAEKRTELLSWLLGQDVYNDDGDTSYTDANNFAPDPLHGKPFVITYSGSDTSNAKDVLFGTDNMGILRAIDPKDTLGTEKWAYIPEEHLDNVREYAGNKAGSRKIYGFDGEVSVLQRESSTSTPSNFQLSEVNLFLGERRGGRNYYSLDVSNADKSFGTPQLKWKIKPTDDSRFGGMGQTWSAMLPRKIKTNCSALGTGCTEIEVLIFAGGYDPIYDDASDVPNSTLGNAIYIVDLATGGDVFFWSAGNSNPSGTTTVVSGSHSHNLELDIDHSIVATPTTVDTDGDGSIDLIFAIDISGKIWRIDFNQTADSAASSDWSSGGKIATLSGSGDKRRFYNPIDISRSHARSGRDNFNLVVGSGYRAHPNDFDEAENRLYVVFDPYTKRRRLISSLESNRYNYVKTGPTSSRAIIVSDLTRKVVGGTGPTALPDHGFYIALSQGEGEKILQRAVTFNDTVIVSSFIPAQPGTEDCAVGEGRSYFLNVGTGNSVFSEPFVDLVHPGIPPEVTILHLPQIAVCIGTECVSPGDTPTDPTKGDGSSEPICDDASAFEADGFASALQAAVTAATACVPKGRAFRSSWREN